MLVSAGILLVAIILASFKVPLLHINNEKQVSYTQLVELVEAHQLTKISIIDNVAKSYTPTSKDKAEYITYLIDDQSLLMEKLKSSDVTVATAPAQNNSVKYYLLGSVFLALLIIFIVVLCSRVASNGIRNKVEMYIDNFREMYVKRGEQLAAATSELPATRAIEVDNVLLANHKTQDDKLPELDSDIEEDLYADENYDEIIDENEIADVAEMMGNAETEDESDFPSMEFDEVQEKAVNEEEKTGIEQVANEKAQVEDSKAACTTNKKKRTMKAVKNDDATNGLQNAFGRIRKDRIK